MGEYLDMDRSNRLIFTFAAPRFDRGETVVTIDIRPDGDGCMLTLTNAGVPAAYQDGNHDGWPRILDGLLPAYLGVHGAGRLAAAAN